MRSVLPLALLEPEGATAPVSWDVQARLRGEGLDEGLDASIEARVAPTRDGPPTRITAAVRRDPDGRLLADLDLATIGTGPLAGATGTATAAHGAGRTTVTGRVATGRGTLDIESVELRDGTPVRVSATFRDLDPNGFLASLPTGSLRGRVELREGAGPSGPGLETRDRVRTGLGGTIALDSSTLGGAPIRGTLDLGLDDRALVYAVDVEGDDQRLDLQGTSDLSGDPLRVTIERARFSGVDPAAWSGGRAPGGRLAGTAALSLTRSVATGVAGTARVALDSGEVAGRTVGPTTVLAEIAADSARIQARGGMPPFTASLDGRARSDGTGGWSGRGTVSIVDTVPEAPDTLGIALTFTAPGRGGDAPVRIAGRGGGRIAAITLDTIRVGAEFREGVLTVEEVLATGPAARIRGGGVLPVRRSGPTAADLHVDAAVADLTALEAVLGARYGGRATLVLRSSGPASAMRHEATLAAAGIRTPWFRADSLEVTAEAQSDSASWLDGVSVRAGAVGRQPILVPLGGLRLLAGLGGAAPAEEAPEPSSGGTIDLTWSRDRPEAVRSERLTGILDGDRWTLVRPAEIRWGDSLQLGEIRLASPRGEVTAAGVRSPDGDHDFRLRVSGLPVQLRRSDGPQAVAWLLDLEARLEGPATRPALSTEARFDPPVGSAGGGSLELDWTERGLAFSGRLDSTGSDAPIAVAGALPLRLSLDPDSALVAATDSTADLSVDARSFSLGGIQPLLDPKRVEGLAGRVDGRLEIGGTTAAPRVAGDLTVAGLAADFVPAGASVRRGRLVLAATGDGVVIREGLLHDADKGEIRLGGSVGFPRLDSVLVDVRADLDAFTAAGNPSATAVLSGFVTAAGPVTTPAVRGRLQVVEGTVRLGAPDVPRGLEEIELTQSDYLELERRFGLPVAESGPATVGWDGLDLDVTLAAESNLWVRRPYEPGLAIELAGEVRAVKPR
ncbi:MAG: translocation/assembly module TamB domain-containing protein, partial [Gemmatimonadota bacterium]